MFFGSKKPEVKKEDDNSKKDLALITQMNNELAGSLDLKDTLQNALELIIKRIHLMELLQSIKLILRITKYLLLKELWEKQPR